MECLVSVQDVIYFVWFAKIPKANVRQQNDCINLINFFANLGNY